MSVPETSDTANLTEGDIRSRLPIWTALAQLFRDHALHGEDYDRLAADLLVAGHTAESARHILVHDVSPVFYESLTLQGGNAAGWSAQEVETLMREFFAKSEARRKWLRVQAGRMSRRVMLGPWEQLERRMIAHKASPDRASES
jgi:hypothetical protein